MFDVYMSREARHRSNGLGHTGDKRADVANVYCRSWVLQERIGEDWAPLGYFRTPERIADTDRFYCVDERVTTMFLKRSGGHGGCRVQVGEWLV